MKISVVGSINTDMTVQAERIPLRGETLRGHDLCYIPGGKGANQAVALARLGADVTMFGAVGDDANGELMLSALSSAGVKTEFIRKDEKEPTGLAIITVGDSDNTIIVVPGANDTVSIDYINSIKEELLSSDMVVLQLEVPLSTVEYVLDLCRERGIKTVLNPAPAVKVSRAFLEKTTYLTPNEHETALLFEGEELESLLRQYPEKLIVTLGSEGSAAFTEGEMVKVPAIKTTVVDTTGAGDCLNGALAYRLALGDSLKDALVFANTAAGLSVEKLGAQSGMPALKEVKERLRHG